MTYFPVRFIIPFGFDELDVPDVSDILDGLDAFADVFDTVGPFDVPFGLD